jgi:hypothetical protein
MCQCYLIDNTASLLCLLTGAYMLRAGEGGCGTLGGRQGVCRGEVRGMLVHL